MDSFKFARRPRVHSHNNVSVYPGWMRTHIVSTAANPTYPNVMGMVLPPCQTLGRQLETRSTLDVRRPPRVDFHFSAPTRVP